MDQIKKEYKDITLPENFEEKFFLNLPKRKRKNQILLVPVFLLLVFFLIPSNHIHIYYEDIDLTSDVATVTVSQTSTLEKRNREILILDVEVPRRSKIEFNDDCCILLNEDYEIIDSDMKIKGNMHIMIDTTKFNIGQKELIKIGSETIKVEKIEDGFIISNIQGGNNNE